MTPKHYSYLQAMVTGAVLVLLVIIMHALSHRADDMEEPVQTQTVTLTNTVDTSIVYVFVVQWRGKDSEMSFRTTLNTNWR